MPYIFFPLGEDREGALIACSSLEKFRDELLRQLEPDDEDSPADCEISYQMVRLPEKAPGILLFDNPPACEELACDRNVWEDLVRQGDEDDGSFPHDDLIDLFTEAMEKQYAS